MIMHIQSFTKSDIALQQIETALDLYLNNKDYFSVITLAGAGEEILGQLLKEAGKENSLGQRTASLVGMYDALSQKRVEERRARNDLNRARNSIKHMDDKNADFRVEMDPAVEAVDMLYRAIENYYSLCSNLTPNMQKFLQTDVQSKMLR
jgi:hypothetical protein